MNLFNVCTNVVVVGKINRSSSSSTNKVVVYIKRLCQLCVGTREVIVQVK